MWGRNVEEGVQEEECVSRRVCPAEDTESGEQAFQSMAHLSRKESPWVGGGPFRTESLDLPANTGMQGLKH